MRAIRRQAFVLFRTFWRWCADRPEYSGIGDAVAIASKAFASLAEWVEMPHGIVARIMGHTPSATAERHYISRPLELLAVWHTKYEAWILKEAGIEFEAKADAPRLQVVVTAFPIVDMR